MNQSITASKNINWTSQKCHLLNGLACHIIRPVLCFALFCLPLSCYSTYMSTSHTELRASILYICDTHLQGIYVYLKHGQTIYPSYSIVPPDQLSYWPAPGPSPGNDTREYSAYVQFEQLNTAANYTWAGFAGLYPMDMTGCLCTSIRRVYLHILHRKTYVNQS